MTTRSPRCGEDSSATATTTGLESGRTPAAIEKLRWNVSNGLRNRPQFISHERSVDATAKYLHEILPAGNFTFQAMSFGNHTDTWVLRDIPERKSGT